MPIENPKSEEEEIAFLNSVDSIEDFYERLKSIDQKRGDDFLVGMSSEEIELSLDSFLMLVWSRLCAEGKFDEMRIKEDIAREVVGLSVSSEIHDILVKLLEKEIHIMRRAENWTTAADSSTEANSLDGETDSIL